MKTTLKVSKLKKTFSSGFILQDLCFDIDAAGIICIFGMNGSGKTTLFSLLTGNLEADSGEIFYSEEMLFRNKYDLKRKIGYLPQESVLPNWVTPLEILHYAARLYNLENPQEKVQYYLDFWDCNFFSKRPISSCSHGMQKRVGLALCSLHEPNYLILDEPFTGLDLTHIYRLEEYIKARQKNGKITLISTHLAPYAADLCTEAYHLNDGVLVKLELWEKGDYQERMNLIRGIFSK